MNRFKVALFDLDGTILDTEGEYSKFWGGIGKLFHPEMPDFANVIKGTTLTQIFSRYFPDLHHQTEIKVKLDEWERNMQYRYVAGAVDFVYKLKSNGIKTAIITSSNEEKMHLVKRGLPEINHMFNKIVTSEMFCHSKPHPECYLLGAKLFGVTAEQCVVFEDAFTGLDAGMRAGMFTIGLATTNSSEMMKDKCNIVVNDFKDKQLHSIFPFIINNKIQK